MDTNCEDVLSRNKSARSTDEVSVEISEESRNYFQKLPEEIQLMIFSHFTSDQLFETVSPVCTQWKRLSEDPSLWTKVTLTNSNHLDMLHRSKRLTSLRVDPKIRGRIPYKHLKALKELDLSGCWITRNDFKRMVWNCPLLEDLNLSGGHYKTRDFLDAVSLLPNMRRLNLSYLCCGRADPIVRKVAAKCQYLELLNITCVNGVVDRSICKLARHRKESLLHLYLDGYRLTDVSMIALSNCRNLRTLYVNASSFTSSFTDVTLEALRSLPNLSSLHLPRFSKCCDATLQRFFKYAQLSDLKDLNLNYSNISDATLRILGMTCKNLRTLSLDGCRYITKEGLEFVPDGCVVKRANIYDLFSRDEMNVHYQRRLGVCA